MPKWLWFGLLGVVLLVPGALYWIWVFVSDPVRPSDGGALFSRLAEVPLSQAAASGGVDITTTIPSDAAWKRVIRQWGDSGYFIGAVVSGPTVLYCLKDLGAHVEVRTHNQPVKLETADIPYGYSTDCRPTGLLFHAPPGSTVRIHVTIASRPSRPASLIVEPYRTGDTKDRLVGIGLQQQFHLGTTAAVLGSVGIVLISVAAFLFWRHGDRKL